MVNWKQTRREELMPVYELSDHKRAVLSILHVQVRHRCSTTSGSWTSGTGTAGRSSTP